MPLLDTSRIFGHFQYPQSTGNYWLQGGVQPGVGTLGQRLPTTFHVQPYNLPTLNILPREDEPETAAIVRDVIGRSPGFVRDDSEGGDPGGGIEDLSNPLGDVPDMALSDVGKEAFGPGGRMTGPGIISGMVQDIAAAAKSYNDRVGTQFGMPLEQFAPGGFFGGELDDLGVDPDVDPDVEAQGFGWDDAIGPGGQEDDLGNEQSDAGQEAADAAADEAAGFGESSEWHKGGPVTPDGKPGLDRRGILQEGEYVINRHSAGLLGHKFLDKLNSLR